MSASTLSTSAATTVQTPPTTMGTFQSSVADRLGQAANLIRDVTITQRRQLVSISVGLGVSFGLAVILVSRRRYLRRMKMMDLPPQALVGAIVGEQPLTAMTSEGLNGEGEVQDEPVLLALEGKSRTMVADQCESFDNVESSGVYHAVIVGAGPAGSTTAYYLASLGVSVLLLDKCEFPRDKPCGDAVCTPAIDILQEMGTLKTIMDNNEGHMADNGGVVSPSGISYIGRSLGELGRAAAVAVKRINLDYRMVLSAKEAGAVFKDGREVVDAHLHEESGVWSITYNEKSKYGVSGPRESGSVDLTSHKLNGVEKKVANGSGTAPTKVVQCRVLIIADGSASKLATQLSMCNAPPLGVCSRAFVEGGTHNCSYDGVCFYQPESVPGYSAIFRHPNDELNYCYYLIPTDNYSGQCGNVTARDLPRLHNDAIKDDPFISASLGPDAKIERMKAGSLRIGCQGVPKSYGKNVLIVGDAAGLIDPLTGEGIHTAMISGKAAAITVAEMVDAKDYSLNAHAMYEKRWKYSFGHDFLLSSLFSKFIYRFPVLMDAVTNEMRRGGGDALMSKWAEVMTGLRPKTYLLRPDNAFIIVRALLREACERLLDRLGFEGYTRDYYNATGKKETV